MSLEFSPSALVVPRDDLVELQRRLSATRWPNALTRHDFDYGVSLETVQLLTDTWRTQYQWSAHEERLNAVDQLRTEVFGQPLHLLHVRSPHADALPLLLMNGFPSSAYQWIDVIAPLTRPTEFGGTATDAFHVIAPTIPGFTLSGPTRISGWDPRRIAEAYAIVLAALGYSRYGVEGSDFGSMIAVNLADIEATRVAGLHLSTVPVMRSYDRIERAQPPKDVDPNSLSPETKARLELDAQRWRASASLRAMQQAEPQTLGFALEDSPAGLLAWFGGGGQLDRERHASDSPDFGSTVSPRDHFLTNLSLFWFTRTATSAMRLYSEVRNAGRRNVPRQYVRVPTGIRMASTDVSHTPREWVERKYNVTHWLEGRPGGHFAAADAPLAYVDDLRIFFRSVR